MREYLHLVWMVPFAAALGLTAFVLHGLYVAFHRGEWRGE